MKSVQIVPTKDNLLKALNNDVIGRNKQVYYFAAVLNSVVGPYTFAVNARWGDGKTFFVKQTQMLLDACNPFSDSLTETEKKMVKQSVLGSLRDSSISLDGFQPQMTVYYDAWACDSDVDPVLSLVYEIAKASSSYLEKNSPDGKNTFFNITQLLASVADAFTGWNTSGVVSSIKNLTEKEDPLAEIKKHRDLHEAIRDFFAALPIERGNRIVVFIDELDRCKPDYAINLLERIKHYFDIENLTFVFSVNIEELCHTIKQFYGEGFSASNYLTRFFDYTINLPTGDLQWYYRSIGLNDSLYVFEEVCKAVIEYYNFSLRDLAQFYEKCRIAVYKPTHDSSIYYSDGGRYGLFVLIPIMVGLELHNHSEFRDFVDGNNAKPLQDVLQSGSIARTFLGALLNRDETYSDKTDGKKQVSIEQKLQEYYNAIFAEDYAGAYEHYVGSIECNRESKKTILDALSGLTAFADLS